MELLPSPIVQEDFIAELDFIELYPIRIVFFTIYRPRLYIYLSYLEATFLYLEAQLIVYW